MSAKPVRRGISASPPVVPDTGAEAFVKGAAVHVSTAVSATELSGTAPSAAAKPGRPRKYDTPPKALTIRVSLDAYEDLRYLEYVLRKGSIQEIAAELLEDAAKEMRKRTER